MTSSRQLPRPLRFPPRFTWGVASAAPQVEGAAFEDGKGESVWDRFARQPGRVLGGDTLDVACDHYHRFREDARLMRSLGVRHYRLSIAWPRLFPTGDGPLNQRGLDFYRRLLDALASEGITPWVTLFHWDLPQALEDRGGWPSRSIVDAFARYADAAVSGLGDAVNHWITLNEIRCFTLFGYGPNPRKAPGRSVSAAELNNAFHHALLCHGHAVRAVREHGTRRAQVGLTDNASVAVPFTETAADVAAARSWFASENLHILDPVYRGSYSPAWLRRCGKDRPAVRRGDFALISLPTDFLGLNIYTGSVVRAGPRGRPQEIPFPPHYPRSDCTWLQMLARTLHWGPRFCHELYKPKAIIITENGIGWDDDAPDASGEINDLHRIDYVRACLGEVHRAISNGTPIRGYFLWCFMDNFEWEDGYRRRFGSVHVDFSTQLRTPKLSAYWYQKVIAANSLL